MENEKSKRAEPVVTAYSKSGLVTVLFKGIKYYYSVDFGIWEKMMDRWRYSPFKGWNDLKKIAGDNWWKEEVEKVF